MGSKNRIAKDILPIMLKEAEKHNITTWIEPFCLHEDTIVFTENGIKKMIDVSIGDFIYSDSCELVKVINKIKSPLSEGLAIKLKGNVILKSTPNHKFYLSNGDEILADSIKVGDSMLTGKAKDLRQNIIIDLANFVNIENPLKRGSRGGKVYEDKVKISHNSVLANRFIELTPDVCWAIGLVIAEGSKASLTLHENEKHIADRFIEIYSKMIGVTFDSKIYTYSKISKALSVAIPHPKIYEAIFFKAIKIGYGARNKNLSIAFQLKDEELISLLKGMNDGDGCIRKRNNYYSWNYKTASITLAKQLQTILSTKLGIKSTLSQGINKQKVIENRILKSSDYCNISVNRITDIAILTSNVINGNNHKVIEDTKGFVVKSIDNIIGNFYDITLENESSHKFIIDGGIVTHNCGGANLIDKVPNTFKRTGLDVNPHTIQALIGIRDHLDKLPSETTEEYYKEIKGTPPNPITSWIRFVASFGGRFENGYGRHGTTKEYRKSNTLEGLNNAKKQSPLLQGIELICTEYDKYDYPDNCIIYCDPPYQGVTAYKGTKFDHDKFWKWCEEMSKKHIVFISEYNAPENFKCIWEKEIQTCFASNRTKAATKIEKLFVHNNVI